MKRQLNNLLKKEIGNISVDGLHGETRDLVGALSTFSLFHNKVDSDSSELERHFLIRREFFKMIEEFESVRKLIQPQEKGNNNVEVEKLNKISRVFDIIVV